VDSLTDIAQLADAGRFEEAARRCEDFIRDRGPSADGFYLLGLVHDAQGSAQEAIVHYRKALYLAPQHQDALLHLSALMESLNQTPEATRLRIRARRAATEGGR
jgi:chemotaxis protein methyltransferase WspC